MSQNPQGQGSNGNAQAGNQQGTAQQGTAQGGQQAQAAGQQGRGQPPRERRSTAREVGGWFAETTARTAVLLIGVAVLLFALGQAVGAPLLEAVGEFLSGFGMWLVVAFFALLLIVAATKSWRTV
jgi:uncharacterized membrane protein YdbT with pleckstrin-like domain